MESFELIPIDTLFVRDGRPLAAGGFYGRGARWPSPPTLFGALRTALLERAGTLPAGRSLPGARRGGVPRGRIGTAAFQWLRIQGPFPVLGEKVYFPRPADLVADLDAGFLEPLRPFPVPVIWRQSNLPSPLSNLPSPLTYAVGVGGRPGKEEQPVRWVERAFLEKYLAGAEKLRRPEHVEIWDAEPRIGVAIEALTQAAKEGQLYLAEHLRLREGVRLRFAAGDRPTHKAPDPQEAGLGVGSLLGETIRLGGEGRFVRMTAASSPLRLPAPCCRGVWVKWVLLTPAVFFHGWRPGWIDPDGQVRLRVIEKEEHRERRRRRREEARCPEAVDAASIRAWLRAACLEKPEPLTGWSVLSGAGGEGAGRNGSGGSKPTLLAVPAGSVYYFEAESEPEAQKLLRALHGRWRSDFQGEKGLGLGVCGIWQPGRHPGMPHDVGGRPGGGPGGAEPVR